MYTTLLHSGRFQKVKLLGHEHEVLLHVFSEVLLECQVSLHGRAEPPKSKMA